MSLFSKRLYEVCAVPQEEQLDLFMGKFNSVSRGCEFFQKAEKTSRRLGGSIPDQ